MLISCPKCNAIYDIADDLIPAEGKKLRCSRCGNVWLAKQEDKLQVPENSFEAVVSEPIEPVIIESEEAKADFVPEIPVIIEAEEPTIIHAEEPVIIHAEEPAAPQPVKKEEQDPNEIFTRLADQTQIIFGSDKDIAPIKQSAIKEGLGLHKKSNQALYFLVFFLLVFLSLFYARYEITRFVPFMGGVYKSLGIKAVIPGYGLEFQNVTRREFEEDYIQKMEIKGFVANVSSHMVDVPTISIQMLDKDANVLQTAETKVPVLQLAPEGRISFTAVIVKPSTFTAYVLLTFVDE